MAPPKPRKRPRTLTTVYRRNALQSVAIITLEALITP